MGTAMGAYLTRAGEEVLLVSRNEEHISSLREKGALVTGKDNFSVHVSACLPEEIEGEFDFIILQTKQRENPTVLPFLKNFLAENGVVCSLQNGIPELAMRKVFSDEQIYGAACVWGANLTEPGVVQITSEKKSFSLGGLSAKEETLFSLKEILSKVGEVSVEENLLGARMSKLAFNAALSSLSTITGLPFGNIAKKPSLNKIAREILKECFAVSKAAGIQVSPLEGKQIAPFFERGGKFSLLAPLALKIAVKKHADITSGMLKDIERGRHSDIDFINGAIVSLGNEVGVKTPYNEKAVSLVHDIENGLCEIAPETAEFFREIEQK